MINSALFFGLHMMCLKKCHFVVNFETLIPCPLPLQIYDCRFFYSEIKRLCTTDKENDGHSVTPDVGLELLLCLDKSGRQHKFAMRPGWKLHMYITQMPCKKALLFPHIVFSFQCDLEFESSHLFF